MSLYLADCTELDLFYEVTFHANSFEKAQDIAELKGWELIGELLETQMVSEYSKGLH